MTKVSVGLDLSYSRTGFAVVARPGKHLGGVHFDRFKTEKEDSFIGRTAKIRQWVSRKLDEILAGVKVDVIVVEGPGLKGQMAAMMNGLDVTILTSIFENYPEQEIIVVPPRSLKKYAEVKGNGKTAVVKQVKARFLPTAKGICHDEADAVFLAMLGLDYLTLRENPLSTDVQSQAKHILFQTELNSRGQEKGLILRPGEFHFPPRTV